MYVLVYETMEFIWMNATGDDDDDDDDVVYLRLQHGKGFHNLVYVSHVKLLNPASKA